MNKKITLRSDPTTLEAIRKKNIENYDRFLQKINKGRIDFLKLLSVLIIISYGLSFMNQTKDLIILSIVLIPIFILLISFEEFKKLSNYLLIKRSNKEFKIFAEKYKGISFVHYTLHEDTLDSEDREKYTYRWSDFLKITEGEDEFWLITDRRDNSINIPKIATLNEEDYEYFKSFAKSKIKH